ncbi:MAG: hypothetical protein WC070_03055 [Candidatus Magasanikbacteria bacterium]
MNSRSPEERHPQKGIEDFTGSGSNVKKESNVVSVTEQLAQKKREKFLAGFAVGNKRQIKDMIANRKSAPDNGGLSVTEQLAQKKGEIIESKKESELKSDIDTTKPMRDRSFLAEARSAERRREEYVATGKRKQQEQEEEKLDLEVAYKNLASAVVKDATKLEEYLDNDVLNRQYFAKDGDIRSDKIAEVRSGFVDNGKVSGDKIVVRNIDEEAFLRDYKETGVIKHFEEEKTHTPEETGVIKHFEEEKIKTPEELKSECIVIIKELKTNYGVNVNEDGTIPAGFLGMNRKKVLKLEETVPIFSATTKELVDLNTQIYAASHNTNNVRVSSNVKRNNTPRTGGNVLTGN